MSTVMIEDIDVPMSPLQHHIHSLTAYVANEPCALCSSCYIGQTGGSLSCWLREHKAVAQLGDITSSALAEHCLIDGHSITWGEAQAIETCCDWHHCCSMEL